MPEISVIVPVYNAARHLPTCLSSIVHQTFSDIEIILVDDGSTDGSAELCDAAAMNDVRVRVMHQEHSGSTAARKTGLRLALSKYVTFVDSDDWIEPNLCQVLLEAAMCHGAELVIGAHFIDQDGSSREMQSSLSAGFYDRNRLERDVFPVLFHNDFEDAWSIYPYLCGKLFLRDRLWPLQELVDDGIGLGDDVCVTFPYLVQCSSLVLVRQLLYHYVQQERSQFRMQVGEGDLARFRRIYQLVSASWRGKPYATMLQNQLRTYLLTTILLPRAPLLLSGRSERCALFPFKNMKYGRRVILYGAGILGTACYTFIQKSQSMKLILWLDARAEVLRQQGAPVNSLEEIRIWPECDVVLVAVMKKSTAGHICQDLIRAGIAEDKIQCVDERNVVSYAAWKAFGMECLG